MSAGRNSVSEKKDWNTPPKYVAPVIKFFGGQVDLDPCSNAFSLINATTNYILPTDGLQQVWNFKRIYINPPYGKNVDTDTSIYDWINKDNLANKEFGSEVLLLIPVATNTKHFKDIIFRNAKGICFLSDTRLKFWTDGKEDPKGAPMSCCMVYFGSDYVKFEKIFNSYGKCFEI